MNIIKKIFINLLIISSIFLFVGCKKEPTNEVLEPPKELPIATIDVEGFGIIEAELYPHIAPNTVSNFIELSNNGFYNDLSFHRVVKDFVIQGGCPDGNGMGGPGYSIFGEFEDNGFRNDLLHTEGILSMARNQSPDSAGSQFFIVTEDAPHLDKKYAGFGKVVSGMDVVDKIEGVENDPSNNMPSKKVIINSIKVDTKGVDYSTPDKL